MSKQNKIPNFKAMGEKLMKDLLIDAEVKGLEFIEANFIDEGFYDNNFEAWPARKNPTDYNLLRITNSLFNSITANNNGKNKVIFTADMPYAQIHNEGGTIKQNFVPTAKMKKFFWAMYLKTGMEKYKFMAMAKRINRVITIPKRQFMGHSALFSANIDSYAAKKIEKRFKNIEQK